MYPLPAHDFLNAFIAEEVALGQRPQDIVIDQLEDLFLLCILFQAGVLDVGVHHHEVLLPLAG